MGNSHWESHRGSHITLIVPDNDAAAEAAGAFDPAAPPCALPSLSSGEGRTTLTREGMRAGVKSA